MWGRGNFPFSLSYMKLDWWLVASWLHLKVIKVSPLPGRQAGRQAGILLSFHFTIFRTGISFGEKYFSLQRKGLPEKRDGGMCYSNYLHTHVLYCIRFQCSIFSFLYLISNFRRAERKQSGTEKCPFLLSVLVSAYCWLLSSAITQCASP